MVTKEERNGGDKLLLFHKRRVMSVMKDRKQTKQPEERNDGGRVLSTRRGKGQAGSYSTAARGCGN